MTEQFTSVFTNDDNDPNSDAAPVCPSYPPIDKLEIREPGIFKLLEGINPKKASGPDQIPCHLLKELASELTPVITSFFQQSLRDGELPNSWLTARVTPVFKKGTKN